MEILANEFIKIEDGTAQGLSCYSPGICMGEDGRIVSTCEVSGNVKVLERNPGTCDRYGVLSQGRIYISDDKGKTFNKVHEFPFMHARPFRCGRRLYVLGHCADLMIIASDDNGMTWSAPSRLTDGEDWHQAPTNVHFEDGRVYIVMEKRKPMGITGWMVNNIAPVVMRGSVDCDLLNKDNWTFASELYFHEAVQKERLEYSGIPFFWTTPSTYVEIAPGRACAEIGWLETNIVRLHDERHYFHDKGTLHLFMRAHTGLTGYAAMAKVVEKDDGTMETMLEEVPSGRKIVYVPMPGGQMKFHILFDTVTELYWLLSTQATDSMTRAELLPDDRYNLPDNERRRLVLHFSKNCFDWCFAGIVAEGRDEKMSRNYAAMEIDGDDLYIVSRSGDENAKSAHDGNFISFHKIKQFRKLVY
ncbi:MAG: sialidase family protein [Clostridia bacterium]